MDVVVSRCARIDIGKAEVVVCLRIPRSRGKRVAQVRTFSAVTGGFKLEWVRIARTYPQMLDTPRVG
jgi:hypothetical protein